MTRGYPFPLSVWALLGLLIAGLSYRHPTHATSPDSLHYLRMATTWRAYDGTFPPGYSLLIWATASLTQMPVLWASKLVNWLALGVFGWLWTGRVGSTRAGWLLALWLLPGNLRIATYTWSEAVFVVGLLETIWHLSQQKQNRPNRAWLLLALLPWVRYVGLFMFVRRVPASSLVGVGLLFALNIILTNHLFGGPRLLPTEPLPDLFEMASGAMLNEFLLYNRPHSNPTVFWLALTGQAMGVVGLFLWLRRNEFFIETRNPLVRDLFRTGLIYFLTLFVLRCLSPFDPLNERLMMPGSMCWLVGLMLSVQSQHSMMSRSPERAETRTNPS